MPPQSTKGVRASQRSSSVRTLGSAAARRRRSRSASDSFDSKGARSKVSRVVAGQPEPDLDFAELHRLEAGCRVEEVAKIQEIEGRHGFHDVELVHEELQDLVHAGKAVDHPDELPVVDGVLGEVRLDARQLVQDLLEPELVDLVHGDEEHLVMGGLAPPHRSPGCWAERSWSSLR